MIAQTVALTGANSGDVDVVALADSVDAAYEVEVRVLPPTASNTVVVLAPASFSWNESDPTTGDWFTLVGPTNGSDVDYPEWMAGVRLKLQAGDSLYAAVLGGTSATAIVSIIGNPAC